MPSISGIIRSVSRMSVACSRSTRRASGPLELPTTSYPCWVSFSRSTARQLGLVVDEQDAPQAWRTHSASRPPAWAGLCRSRRARRRRAAEPFV